MSFTNEQLDGISNAIAAAQVMKRDGLPSTPDDVTTQARQDLEMLFDNLSKDELAVVTGVLLGMVVDRYSEEELTALALGLLGAA